MKILFVGALATGQTSRMRMEELERLGHEVRGVDGSERWNQLGPISRRFQQWRASGATVDSLNSEVADAARGFGPDLVWAEKQEYLRYETLAEVKADGARLLHYTPDPYFSLSWKRTALMDAALPLFDFLVTSKQYELDSYRRYPAKTIYVPLGYSESVHRPLLPCSRSEYASYASDISFLGGWEPRRERLLDAVSNLPNVTLKVWGYGWDHLADGRKTPRRLFAMRRNAGGEPFTVKKNPILAACVRGNEVYGDQYAWAISAARISIGFLRTAWPDQHTTRTFEIPACGSMMLADRTDEHRSMFEEGKEAEFFESESELLEKLSYYAKNEAHRERIARAGYNRCLASGYSYRSRVFEIMGQLE